MNYTNRVKPGQFDDNWIIARRPGKNPVNPRKPYTFFIDSERTVNGRVEDVANVFLTNRECPFHCLMCDLWKNTTDHRTSPGAIPEQIRRALRHLPATQHIKLYNNGNFFDRQAIPPSDMPRIAELLKTFKTVTVENHPRLVNERCLSFQNLLNPKLHIAMGLETVNTTVLELLNKQMTLKDFERATIFLKKNGISVRAFILLRPPFLTENEGVHWAKKSLDFAFNTGVECCVIIPTREGNGALEYLRKRDMFHPPRIESLEEVLEYGIRLKLGRVFIDLWDINKFLHCDKCCDKRIERIHRMNLTQEYVLPVICDC